jgi:protein involved in polysaccharide export with SLBB domain
MLAPSDYVEFRTIPDYRETATISLQGEFVFPGVYAFDKGETLNSVIQRAGGFTAEAFVDGAVFLREFLKVREQKELDRLAQVLNDDLNADRLRDVNSDIDVNESQLALQRNAVLALTSAEALGRLVIPLSDIVNFSVEDIILKANDRLLIPKFSQEVTVIGEVQRPTSYLYDASFSQADYLMQSGGIKPSADRRGIYVVKAGGQVVMPTRGFLRFRSPQANIGPGDTIVVPLDTDDTRIRGIPLLAEVSTIIYQLALGAAAVNSFSTP